MRYEFTPASERALAIAACWACEPCRGELHPPEVLLGLLAEEECRAAQMLGTRGINTESLLARWPLSQLRSDANVTSRLRQFSVEMEASLAAAASKLAEYPKPPTFATEHLLLGLASADHELAIWLAERGLEADGLEAEIHRLYGYTIAEVDAELDPLPVELLEATTIRPPNSPQGQPSSFTNLGLGESSLSRLLSHASITARETLRVVQDYAELVLRDPRLATRLAADRETLLAALGRCGMEPLALVSNRSVDGQLAANASARDTSDVAVANLARYQESLRSLEEYVRPADPSAAALFEGLRLASYAHVGENMMGDRRRAILAAARLYVLLDGQADAGKLESLASSLVAAGVDVLQLRDKALDDRALLERARALCRAARGTETLTIINDRPDLAVLAEADGVHVGQEELSVADARRVIGPDALVGVSTHSVVQAQQAERDEADYIGVGPTFSSDTKQFSAIAGIALLSEVAPVIRLPAFAIGGITSGNLSQVLSAGFCRVAVSGAVMKASDPAEAARRLLALLPDDA